MTKETILTRENGSWEVRQLDLNDNTTGIQPQFNYRYFSYLNSNFGFVVEIYNENGKSSRLFFYNLNESRRNVNHKNFYFVEVDRLDDLGAADVRAPTYQITPEERASHIKMWNDYWIPVPIVTITQEQYIASQQHLQYLSSEEKRLRYENYMVHDLAYNAQQKLVEIQKELDAVTHKNEFVTLETVLKDCKADELDLDNAEAIEDMRIGDEKQLELPGVPPTISLKPELSKKLSKEAMLIHLKDYFVTLLNQSENHNYVQRIYLYLNNESYFKNSSLEVVTEFMTDVNINILLCEKLAAKFSAQGYNKMLMVMLMKLDRYSHEEFALVVTPQNLINYVNKLKTSKYNTNDTLFVSIANKAKKLQLQHQEASTKLASSKDTLKPGKKIEDSLERYVESLNHRGVNEKLANNPKLKSTLFNLLDSCAKNRTFDELSALICELELTSADCVNLMRLPHKNRMLSVCALEKIMTLPDDKFFTAICEALDYPVIRSLINSILEGDDYASIKIQYNSKLADSTNAAAKKLENGLRSDPKKTIKDLQYGRINPSLISISTLSYCLENFDSDVCSNILNMTPNSIFLKKDNDANNILHIVSKLKFYDGSAFILVIKKYLDVTHFNDNEILEENAFKRNFIQLFIESSTPLNISILFEIYKFFESSNIVIMQILSLLTTEQVEELLHNVEKSGRDAKRLHSKVLETYYAEYSNDTHLKFIESLIKQNNIRYLSVLLSPSSIIAVSFDVVSSAISDPNVNTHTLKVLASNVVCKKILSNAEVTSLLLNTIYARDFNKLMTCLKSGMDPTTVIVNNGRKMFFPFILMVSASLKENPMFGIKDVSEIFKFIINDGNFSRKVLNYYEDTSGAQSPEEKMLSDIQFDYTGLLELSIGMANNIKTPADLDAYKDLLKTLIPDNLFVIKLTFIDYALDKIDNKKYAREILQCIVNRLKEAYGTSSIVFAVLMTSHVTKYSSHYERCLNDSAFKQFEDIFDVKNNNNYARKEELPAFKSVGTVLCYDINAYNYMLAAIDVKSAAASKKTNIERILYVMNHQLTSVMIQCGTVPQSLLNFISEIEINLSVEFFNDYITLNILNPLLVVRAVECMIVSEKFAEFSENDLREVFSNLSKAFLLLKECYNGFEHPSKQKIVGSIVDAIKIKRESFNVPSNQQNNQRSNKKTTLRLG